MKVRLFLLLLISLIATAATNAQQIISNPGIWQTFGAALSLNQHPDLNGRLSNFRWADIETANNVWNWKELDNDLTSKTKDGLPVIFMIYTGQDAPTWLYDNGVPKVPEKDNKGNIIDYVPYYADPTYKSFFVRMIQKVHAHIETLSSSVRNKIVGVQGCFGSTGDYIGYKGTVPNQYYLDGTQFFQLFQEFSLDYYDEYKNTNPKIYLLSNPRNQGSDQATWVVQNCPGWLKTATLGKGYQLNDEVDKYQWLYPMLNNPQLSGDFIRARSEMIGGNLNAGWWKTVPYQNMFAVMCYGVFWGLDWNNQGSQQLSDLLNDSAYAFFNKYAGQKDPATSTNAMCALKDVLDASDGVRFPAATYGTVSRNNQQRYINIANKFSSYGARLDDVKSATLNETDNIQAKGINDVGWNLFTGNYDRYLHQLNANKTSAGYWNVASNDLTSMYGRFARGFDIANNKKALYFDVDDTFLNNTPLNGKYTVTIEVTYLDQGTGGWKLYYDAKSGTDVSAISVSCTNSNLWKKATIKLKDAYFGNRGPQSSDFSIRSNNSNKNVIFSIVELSRPANFAGFTSIQNNSAVAQSTSANINASQVSAYPNPAKNYFTITAADEIKQVLVYNQSGQLVLQKQVAANTITINKTEIGNVAGVYFVKVFTASKTFTNKVVIL